MSFHDLPADWARRPMTDPDLFEDVLDLVVDERARRGSVTVIVCRPDGTIAQPFCLDRAPVRWRPGSVAVDVGRLFRHLGGAFPGVRVVVAIGRTGPPFPDRRDRDLQERLLAAALGAGVEVVGYALATPAGITALADTPTRRTA